MLSTAKEIKERKKGIVQFNEGEGGTEKEANFKKQTRDTSQPPNEKKGEHQHLPRQNLTSPWHHAQRVCTLARQRKNF